MSSPRRRLLIQCMKEESVHVFATRTIENVQLNYQGILKARSGERVYEFEVEVGKTYAISQLSEVTGYCRTRGWSETPLDVNGQTYNDSLSTGGCTIALGSANFSTIADSNMVFVAKAKYLYAYNQSVTTVFSNQEIYLDEVTV